MISLYISYSSHYYLLEAHCEQMEAGCIPELNVYEYSRVNRRREEHGEGMFYLNCNLNMKRCVLSFCEKSLLGSFHLKCLFRNANIQLTGKVSVCREFQGCVKLRLKYLMSILLSIKTKTLHLSFRSYAQLSRQPCAGWFILIHACDKR